MFMKLNMKDVAEHSGVSLKTVSRVINGEPHVSVQTRQRVEEMITALGYRPNHSARSLRSGRTQTIRLMIVRRFERFLTEPFTDELVSGIVDAAALAGYAPLIEVVGPKRQGANTHQPEGRLVDGTILIDGRPESPALPSDRHNGVPCVVVPTMPTDPSIGWVYADFLGGAERITNQLIKLGHRRIAHLAGRLSLPERDRLRGYRRALASAGIPADLELVVAAGHLQHHGFAATEKLLARRAEFTAVFAVNDAVALGAMECLQRRGYRVPDSISVVGFDDTYAARHAAPPLSTVRLPTYDMGVAATKHLVDAIEGKAPFPSGQVFPVELMLRASMGEPPTQFATVR
jgi:DNA-binding LacI/PurR family transcriptional regulator